jgi:hypothetical protein
MFPILTELYINSTKQSLALEFRTNPIQLESEIYLTQNINNIFSSISQVVSSESTDYYYSLPLYQV